MEAATEVPERVTAQLHDSTRIAVHRLGSGPPILLTVRPVPYDERTAAGMRQWGADPDYGPTLVHGLADRHTVIAADYEGHRLAHPAPHTLTASNVAGDLVAIADAAGATRFGCYGYSWLALSALQLAVRTDRLDALIMGGYPPIGGPYAAMLSVTRAAHRMAQSRGPDVGASSTEITPGDWDAVEVQTDPDQTRQFVTLYEDLQDFYDAVAARRLTVPRFCFAGELDIIDYGPQWGDVRVAIADPLREHRRELEASGWVVELLPGLDHMTAMHGKVVLPLLRRWLAGLEAAPEREPTHRA
jgi:pimeloyl-ACP methyl ester carboxylesterase